MKQVGALCKNCGRFRLYEGFCNIGSKEGDGWFLLVIVIFGRGFKVFISHIKIMYSKRLSVYIDSRVNLTLY